jgi:predicted DNA binding CopG/RHH family protein
MVTESGSFRRGGPLKEKGSNMRKEYDLKKLKKRPGKVKIDKDAVKLPVSIRLDGSVLAAIKTEADRLGIPYQTLIGSILHRYTSNELIDRRNLELAKAIKAS